MDQPRDETISQAPMLALEAIRIAEQSARAAERSAAGALATLERAETSLRASEDRMIEITAAASSAASEATEARLRATEIATEFRSLEERVAEALGAGQASLLNRRAQPQAEPAGSEIPNGWSPAEPPAPVSAPPAAEPTPAPPAAEPAPTVPSSPPIAAPAGGTTAEFEALWDSFDRKADRIVKRLKELEARTMTVIRTPAPHPAPQTPDTPQNIEGRR